MRDSARRGCPQDPAAARPSDPRRHRQQFRQQGCRRERCHQRLRVHRCPQRSVDEFERKTLAPRGSHPQLTATRTTHWFHVKLVECRDPRPQQRVGSRSAISALHPPADRPCFPAFCEGWIPNLWTGQCPRTRRHARRCRTPRWCRTCRHPPPDLPTRRPQIRPSIPLPMRAQSKVPTHASKPIGRRCPASPDRRHRGAVRRCSSRAIPGLCSRSCSPPAAPLPPYPRTQYPGPSGTGACSGMSSNDTHDPCGLYQSIHSDFMNRPILGTQCVQIASCGGQLSCGRGTFHCQHQAARSAQGKAPAGQPVEWCYRPGRHYIELPIAHLLGPRSQHLGVVDTQPVDDLRQEGRPAQQRLDQHHPDVRANQGQHNARQSRAAPDIGDGCVSRNQPLNHRTVQQVPIPQLRHLARPDQPPHCPVRRQDVGVSGQPINRCWIQALNNGGRFT